MSGIRCAPSPASAPVPGSLAARQAGCRCPDTVNFYGAGFEVNGQTRFWVAGDCPLHAIPRDEAQHSETSRDEG